MKKLIGIILILLPYCAYVQNDSQGIRFRNTYSSFKELKDAAAASNKFIFLDCYATWCAPCKVMDQKVYVDTSVGRFMNKHFLSVKVQIDSLPTDEQQLRKWYTDASIIRREMNIKTVPTYLFFSPDGMLVHESSGYKPAAEFIQSANNALNPAKQFYARLKSFNEGESKPAFLKSLAAEAKQIGKTTMAHLIAMRLYETLIADSTSLYKKENLQFLGDFTLSSQDPSFLFFYQNASRIDSAVQDQAFSSNVIDKIITKEMLLPVIGRIPKGSEPDWKGMQQLVAVAYGLSYAERTILQQKINRNYLLQEWNAWGKNTITKVEKYGPGWAGYNGNAWFMFLNVTDKSVLKKAITWAEKDIAKDSLHTDALDTKANLLYKLQKTKMAIATERQAIDIAERHKRRADEYYEALRKMQSSLPTWSN